jgi:hypothetical protein
MGAHNNSSLDGRRLTIVSVNTPSTLPTDDDAVTLYFE